MAFTAQDVKKLREMTNVGMMDCIGSLLLPVLVGLGKHTGVGQAVRH